MNFLLDTNVVSEWTKPRPNPGVIAWLANADEDRVFLSVITVAELLYGIERLPLGTRRESLSEWLEQELPLRFESRILGIDAVVADLCGRLIAQSESMGKRIEITDAFVAATAQIRECTVVTRNVSHFEPVAKNILNPWS